MPEKEKKILVLEQTCIKIINFFFSLDFLVGHNIQKNIFQLSPNLLQTEANIIIYIIHPEIEYISQIEEQIKLISEGETKGGDKEKEYHCIFIPKITNECKEYLSQSEYKDKLIIHCLNIEIFPLDYDLLSMEDPNSFKDIFIEENYSSLERLSRIIFNFENAYGKSNNIYIKGKYAKILSDLVKKEEEIYGVKYNNNTILSCIFMDRSVDYITPFLTQCIYEGLIDELFERQYDLVKVDPEVVDKPSTDLKVKIDLSKQERVYTMIKDYTFNKICAFLPRRIQLHKEIFQRTRAATEVNEIHSNLVYLSQVRKEVDSLHIHVELATYIKHILKDPTIKSYKTIEQRLLQREHLDFIEDLLQDEIIKCIDINTIIKILCIDNLTIRNIKSKGYDKLKNDCITIYGNQERFLFQNLEKLKIIKRKPDKKIYKSILNKLNLINLTVNVHNPNDTSYVFGGFCPISIRLIEMLLREGWKANKDFLNNIPGTVEFPDNESSVLYPSKDNNIILLVFVGGITFSEIAAIRYINSHNEKYKFIIITTSIINPKSFINQLRNGRQKEQGSDKNNGVSFSKKIKNLFK